MDSNYRVSIFGAACVGKTEIINRFAYKNNLDCHKKHHKRFGHHHHQKPKNEPEFEFKKYTPTIEDFHIQCFDYLGFCLSLEIVDTCGTEQFPAMRKLNIERSKLVILVYDVTRNDTIYEAIRLYHIARSIRPVESGLIIMFVGAKSDLLKQPHKSHIIEEFTDKNTDIWLRLILCSAKTGFNIKKIFQIGFENIIPEILTNKGKTRTMNINTTIPLMLFTSLQNTGQQNKSKGV